MCKAAFSPLPHQHLLSLVLLVSVIPTGVQAASCLLWFVLLSLVINVSENGHSCASFGKVFSQFLSMIANYFSRITRRKLRNFENNFVLPNCWRSVYSPG